MIAGIGIHGGRTATVRLFRSDGPLRFRRAGAEIPATVDSVASTARCVTLASGGASVAVVEHLLAALAVEGFWCGVVAEVDGDELPILDGSAQPWLEEIATLGPPPPAPEPLVPRSPTLLPEAQAAVLPGPSSLEVAVDYPHPAIGKQRWTGGPEQWPDLLDARTFGFLAEFELLKAAGLALGASTGNAIVFDDDGPLEPMRYQDEPVRHKALDLLGDLALLGRPLQATVRVEKGSHRVHVNLMRQLLHDMTTEATK